jgi:hypothetical protein
LVTYVAKPPPQGEFARKKDGLRYHSDRYGTAVPTDREVL